MYIKIQRVRIHNNIIIIITTVDGWDGGGEHNGSAGRAAVGGSVE